MLNQFTKTLDLDELLNIPVRNMSLGQKMRSELAAALIHEPKVVYLDEPTIGLDLIVKERIRDFIKKECISKGMTVMLTTHDLGDTGAKPAAKPSAQEQKAAAPQQSAGGASETVSRHSLIQEPTRPHPGWVCPSHPHVKSFYPEGCPIDKIPMMREGEYTCANHPQVSASAPGTCPIGNEPLIKVKDLEQQSGKNIDVLTKEALAKQKG